MSARSDHPYLLHMQSVGEERLTARLAASHKHITHLEDRIRELEESRWGPLAYGFEKHSELTAVRDLSLDTLELRMRTMTHRTVIPYHSAAEHPEHRRKLARWAAYRVTRDYRAAIFKALSP